MNYNHFLIFLVLIVLVADPNVSAVYYEPYDCYFAEHPPKIDGVINPSEWAPFQEIDLNYWITYKGGYTEGATPWDTKTKNSEISFMSNSSHLFICLKIPDDFLSLEYPLRLLQIYLNDHKSEYIDRRGLSLGSSAPHPIISTIKDGIAYQNEVDGDDDVRLGGTMDTIVKYSHTSGGVSGADGVYIFEFDLPFRVATHDIYDVYSTDLDIEILYVEWSKNFEQSECWRTFLKINSLNVIIFDKLFVSKARCDVGSTQQIRIHGIWAGNGLDASGIDVKINNNYYRANSTGWINIEDSSNIVLKKYWNITDVLHCDNYTIFFTNPSIIWDQVGLNIESGNRHDLGWNKLNWVGEYFYDRQPFHGTFSLNDTLLKIETGKYAYKVASISDNLYGLTTFVSNDFSIILDRVNVTLNVSDDRIDVDSKADVRWTACYEYDGSPFQGEVNMKIISGQTSTPTPVGKNSYQVESIEDEKYSLSVFTSNQVDCIFDRVKITQGGVTNALTKTGNMESVWFKAIYEYDGQEFTGEPTDDGGTNKIWVNVVPMAWSSSEKVWKYSTKLNNNGKLTFEVTGIEDMQYKLTSFIDVAGPKSITWEKTFLETPIGIASIVATFIIIGIGVIVFLRKRK